MSLLKNFRVGGLIVLVCSCASDERIPPGPEEEAKLAKLEVGMTRDEVKEILGDEFYSFSGPVLPPVVDSFPYYQDGELRYYWVEYSEGVVEDASSGWNHTYRVE